MSGLRYDVYRSERISRRAALRQMGGAAAGAVLTARIRSASAQDTPQSNESIEFDIPDTGVNLPDTEVTFRWVDSGDNQAVFFRQFFPAYEEKHPNITIQYDPLPWTEIAQIVPLGVRNSNAHDVFQIPLGITGGQAVREGWVAPLNDVIPNFEEWKTAFPPGSFVEGINVFDGKTYALPHNSNQRYSTLLLYNKDLMEQAGYDPAVKPLTWDEFRDAAKKITEQGNGQYYGVIIGGNQVNLWASWVGDLAQMAGSSVSPYAPLGDAYINWKTGECEYASEPWLEAVDLLLGMKDDGSFFPGSLGMNAPQARAMMPQAVAGMILQGPWNIPIWQHETPNFDFGVASLPLPSSGDVYPLTYGPGGSNQRWVFSDSPYKEIAGDIFYYLGSEEGQIDWAKVVGIGDHPIFPSAMEAVELSPQAQKAFELFQEQMVLRPEPLVRNPDVEQVIMEARALTLGLGETIQGIFTGQLADPKQALQDLEDRCNAELDRAIQAAQEKGANVSRKDFVFPNWDRAEDYTDEDYAELQS